MTTQNTDTNVRDAVRDRYARAAEGVSESCCGSDAGTGSCCGNSLYEAEEIEVLPETVTDASLGCGNPTALDTLTEGEVVLDLGSGGGIDVFLAAQRVGETGRAIGLDMTPEMIALARKNAEKVGATNVEFIKGEIEDIPLPDESVDVIISNCVINLSTDKPQVFREAFRVLRPGGRLLVSDIVSEKPLPAEVQENVEFWSACVGGAWDEARYLNAVRDAGFATITVVARTPYPIEELDDDVRLFSLNFRATK